MSTSAFSAASAVDLSVHGLKNLAQVYYNLSKPELYEHAVKLGEGMISSHGALMCDTGKTTGRSPKDKFIIDQPAIHEHIDWNDFNQPKDQATWDHMYAKAIGLPRGQGRLRRGRVLRRRAFMPHRRARDLGAPVPESVHRRTSSSAWTRREAPEEHRPDWVVIMVPEAARPTRRRITAAATCSCWSTSRPGWCWQSARITPARSRKASSRS